MNLRRLRYFCEVVDSGSAAHAAETLHVAPTAISMQLAQLEQHLGGALFDRSRRPMELTPLGKFFYPRARELLAQARRLDGEARGVATGRHGWLGVGFVRSALFSVMPSAVRIFRKSFPEVHLDLVEVLSEYQPALLQQERIDIGVGRFIGDFDRPADLVHTLLFEEPFVAAVPIGHPLASRKAISAAEFASMPFILYPKDGRSPFGPQLLSMVREAGGELVVGYEAVEIHTALALVGAGLGGTLVGRSIAENNRADVTFIPVSDIAATTTLVAFTRRNETRGLVAAFLDVLPRS